MPRPLVDVLGEQPLRHALPRHDQRYPGGHSRARRDPPGPSCVRYQTQPRQIVRKLRERADNPPR